MNGFKIGVINIINVDIGIDFFFLGVLFLWKVGVDLVSDFDFRVFKILGSV